jgi:2-polyprenyl-6-methoxyphenol hydroxylase-like FAD-dependent oxidoreductase
VIDVRDQHRLTPSASERGCHVARSYEADPHRGEAYEHGLPERRIFSTVGAPVVIVGAGFAGLSAAARLSQAGRECVVLERRPELPRTGGAIALQPNGLEALARIGVLEPLLAEGLPLDDGVQRSPRGRELARFSYAELDTPCPFVMAARRARVLAHLMEALRPSAEVRFGCEASSYTRDADGCATGVSGQPASHVIGADGYGSRMREAMGARLVMRSGPYQYVLGVSPHVVPHRDAAMYLGRGFADGAIPMRDGTDFWDTVSGENRAAVEARDFGAWRESYRRRVPCADDLLDGCSSFDDVSLLVGRTHRAVPSAAPGITLVGDAAAAVHPHSGQGANLALADGVGLAEALLEGSDEALGAYVARRDRRMRWVVPYSRFVGLTLDASNPFWRLVRFEGYAGARVPFVRRRLLRLTAGLA